MKTIGYAATAADAPLAPFDIERRALRANDVAIDPVLRGLPFGPA